MSTETRENLIENFANHGSPRRSQMNCEMPWSLRKFYRLPPLMINKTVAEECDGKGPF